MLNYESPYLRLYHQNPNYKKFHTFGCVCFVHPSPPQRNKLSIQLTKCAFIDYSTSHKGFVCYNSFSDQFLISTNVVSSRINISLNLLFLLFFILLRIYHLILSGSNQNLCMNDVGQLPHPEIDPPRETAAQLKYENSSRSDPVEPTWHLLEYLVLPIGMAFPLLYPTFLFQLVTHKLPSMNVGRKQWRKNFRLLKKITYGLLFHVLQMPAQLDVNGAI